MSWYNSIVIGLLRSPLHPMMSKSTMIVNYEGRKSGRPYQLPVNYVEHGEHLLTLSNADRTWWKNLRDGAPVTLRLRGRDVSATGVVDEDDATVGEGLLTLFAAQPQYARFFNIKVDDKGQPLDAGAFAVVVKEKVIVRFTDLQ
ncbi:MAG: nitroreductase family deazaflavin-dependent oxidoreductase [Chloroflexi bacterium]|nr:nitroreductase family deazaflavin-dependent oxidoreductase [Chloroflexota bacterium]